MTEIKRQMSGKRMKYGLIADIHGNLEALQVVLAELRGEGIDQYICLGDVVGYGADPNECLELVKSLEPVIVAGNHDWASVSKTDISYFNPSAREAVGWTSNQLTKENVDYLRNLKLIEEFKNFVVVHSTLVSPQAWGYILTISDAKANFAHQTRQLCFIGHSHQPVIVMEDGDGNCGVLPGFSLELAQGRRYIVNIGSVGQPRDGDPRAAFALYDTPSGQVEIKRVEYDIKLTQDKIIRAGLPRNLALRLEYGR